MHAHAPSLQPLRILAPSQTSGRGIEALAQAYLQMTGLQVITRDGGLVLPFHRPQNLRWLVSGWVTLLLMQLLGLEMLQLPQF